MRSLLPYVLPILVLAGDARAETSVEVSLEWMVAKSDLVVRARFLRRAEIDGHVAGFSIWTYRVEETLPPVASSPNRSMRSWRVWLEPVRCWLARK